MSIPLAPLKFSPLPYSYDAFEPLISEESMIVHHQGHHKAYVENFNRLLSQLESGAVLGQDIPPSSFEFNFYGHLLHSYYWNSISPETTTPGPLTETLIASSYSDEDSFLDAITDTALGIQGSGWVLVNSNGNHLNINQISNHDLWQMPERPLLVVDVWEHAYYIDYQNKKKDFFKNLVEFINWDTFEKRLIV